MTSSDRSSWAAFSSKASAVCTGTVMRMWSRTRVCDALLGAAGLEDIGYHFPDTDERWRGADSISLLEEVAAMVRRAGWEPVNVDCSVVCETPKLAPHRAAMCKRLSAAVGADVSVKATRPEQLGALGREEGVACLAVALVDRP